MKKNLVPKLLILLCITVSAFTSCNKQGDKKDDTHTNTSNTLMENCDGPESCDNPDCQVTIRGIHEISQVEFQDAIERFSVPALAGKVYTASAIEGILNGATSCSTSVLVVSGDSENDENNSEIQLTFNTPGTGNFSVQYSIALFRGVLQLEPVEIHFYKAVTIDEFNNERQDIIFKAVDDMENVLMYGDLSDLFP